MLDLVEGELPSGSRDNEVIRCAGSAGCGGAAVVCCPVHLPDIRARQSSFNNKDIIRKSFDISPCTKIGKPVALLKYLKEACTQLISIHELVKF